MAALVAIVAFAIALILHVTHQGSLVLTFELIGFLALAVALVYPWAPWTRQAP